MNTGRPWMSSEILRRTSCPTIPANILYQSKWNRRVGRIDRVVEGILVRIVECNPSDSVARFEQYLLHLNVVRVQRSLANCTRCMSVRFEKGPVGNPTAWPRYSYGRAAAFPPPACCLRSGKDQRIPIAAYCH